MGKNKKLPLPYKSASAGSAFVVGGIVVACLGLFVIVIEMLNGKQTAGSLVSSAAITFGLLLMVVGYAKQAATAAHESYYLQKRIYEEQNGLRSYDLEEDEPRP